VLHASLNRPQPDPAAEFKPPTFKGVYSLTYDGDSQVVTLEDVQYGTFMSMPWAHFTALLHTTFLNDRERVEAVSVAVLNYRDVRFVPSKAIAAIKPWGAVDFEELTMRALTETAGMAFENYEDMKGFWLDSYGVKLA
jgi:hypothetical protein